LCFASCFDLLCFLLQLLLLLLLLLPQSHGKLAAALSGLAREVQGDAQLAARIRAKYKIKNTVSAAQCCCSRCCHYMLCCWHLQCDAVAPWHAWLRV
jgi:hypothetical protein